MHTLCFKFKYLLTCCVMMFPLLLTGCDREVVIFKENTDPFAQQKISSDDMVPETPYAMDGTGFILTGDVSGNFSGAVSIADPKRVLWMEKKESLVPVMYRNSLIAMKSNTTDLKSVSCERFRDAGYSIGIYGAVFNEQTGMIDLDAQSNIGEATPAYNAIDTSLSTEIHLESINGTKVTADMLDGSGILNCFEKDKSYTIGYYAGTEYKTCSITASAHMLTSWETFSLTDITMTKKGYLAIAIPEDFKSGWYYIGGVGLIKYLDEDYGGEDLTGDDLNVDYFDSEEAKQQAYSQTYAVDFTEKTLNPTVEVIYDKSSISSGQTVSVTLISPDGTIYALNDGAKPAMDESDYQYGENVGYFSVQLKEAIAGKWHVYIQPKEMNVYQVQVLSNKINEEATEENTTFAIDNDLKNQIFVVNWSLTDIPTKSITGQEQPTIFGKIIYPDGETFDLLTSDNTDEKTTLYYKASYLPAGSYTVRVYHYSDVQIDKIELHDDADAMEEETVIEAEG